MRKPWLFPFLLSLSVATMPLLAVAQTSEQLVRQAESAYNARNYSQAEAIWRRVIQSNPSNVVAYIKLGDALKNQGKFDEAIATYRQAIQLDPNNPKAYNNMGLALYSQKKFDEAIVAYRRAIEIEPNAVRYNNLGIALQAQRKLEEAASAYRQALQLPEDKSGFPTTAHTAARNGLGLILQQQGELEEAIEEFKQAIQLDPNYVIAQNNLREVERLVALEINQSSSAGNRTFFCGIYRGQPATLVRSTRTGRNIAIITWSSEYFRESGFDSQSRCQVVSERIEEQYRNGNLRYIRSGTMNGHPIVCTAANRDGPCVALLFTLRPGDNGNEVVRQIFAIRDFATRRPVFFNEDNRRYIDINVLLNLTPIDANPPQPTDDRQWLPNLKEEPLVNVLRSVVWITVEIPTGKKDGAGWVVKREGKKVWIVTNRHVVSDEEGTLLPSEKIEVEFYSEPPDNEYRTRYPARITNITEPNDDLDLAVLEVTDIPDDINPLQMYSTRVGRTTPVRVIGHPSYGGDWSQVAGEISNINRNKPTILIDANLSQGNSGGPVIDYQNRVIGVMVRIETINQSVQAAAGTTQSQPQTTGGFGLAYRIDVVIEKLRQWGIL